MSDNDKVLISKLLLKATFVLLCISVFLKLLGLNIFGVDTSNQILINISNFLDNSYLKNILDVLMLIIQNYLFYRLSSDNENKLLVLFVTIITIILTILIQFNFFKFNSTYVPTIKDSISYAICTIIVLIFFSIVLDNIHFQKRRKIIQSFKSAILWTLIITTYQYLIMFIKSLMLAPAIKSIYDIILNFDYTILLLATYYLKVNNGLHHIRENNFSLSKLLSEGLNFDDIKIMVYKINDFNKKFKESSKTDKVIVILYFFFTILSEIINVSLVVFVAYLNNSIIECLFIITSFLISRKVFGAFHLKSAIQCWFLSNISFYILDKLSLNVGISFVIPVLCGTALAYITSKFIKKNNKDLYKGMSESDLLNISKDKKLTKLELEILKKYYCEGINMNKLTFIYHYSRAQLYRYKSNAEKKITN